ncbi:MAG: molecular chaperone TorD family protein [Deltaproteobacteria bacterium]|nr:molecular chaperone TorD family protein [Deltaproteobacteria bacterium]
MSLSSTAIAALEPALGWLKQAALYPADAAALAAIVGSVGSLRALCASPFEEETAVSSEWLEAPREFLETQQVEFTRLFINRHGGVLAPPYASVYLSGGTLLGEAADDVVALYAEGDLEWAPRPGADTPDHLTVELEFLQHLARLCAAGDEATALEAEDLWTRFWTVHMNSWLPAFQRKLSEGAASPLYRLTARALAGLIEKEKNG